MKKFESIDLDVLKAGDRFYFAKDKHKKVWEMVSFSATRSYIKLVGSTAQKSKVRSSILSTPTTVIFLTSKSERDAL